MPSAPSDPFAPAPPAPDAALTAALHALDTGDFAVTDFEADILESVLRQKTWASAKQRKILAQMLEKYVEDFALAAELCGQQRLL